MAPLPAPAEKPSHRVSDSQSHAKVRPPTQVAVFCAAPWPNLQPALTTTTTHLLSRPILTPTKVYLMSIIHHCICTCTVVVIVLFLQPSSKAAVLEDDGGITLYVSYNNTNQGTPLALNQTVSSVDSVPGGRNCSVANHARNRFSADKSPNSCPKDETRCTGCMKIIGDILQFARHVFESTHGAHHIKRVFVSDRGRNWKSSDIRWDMNTAGAWAHSGGWKISDWVLYLGSAERTCIHDVLHHEFGHYFYALPDRYKKRCSTTNPNLSCYYKGRINSGVKFNVGVVEGDLNTVMSSTFPHQFSDESNATLTLEYNPPGTNDFSYPPGHVVYPALLADDDESNNGPNRAHNNYSNPFAEDEWSMILREHTDLEGVHTPGEYPRFQDLPEMPTVDIRFKLTEPKTNDALPGSILLIDSMLPFISETLNYTLAPSILRDTGLFFLHSAPANEATGIYMVGDTVTAIKPYAAFDGNASTMNFSPVAGTSGSEFALSSALRRAIDDLSRGSDSPEQTTFTDGQILVLTDNAFVADQNLTNEVERAKTQGIRVHVASTDRSDGESTSSIAHSTGGNALQFGRILHQGMLRSALFHTISELHEWEVIFILDPSLPGFTFQDRFTNGLGGSFVVPRRTSEILLYAFVAQSDAPTDSVRVMGPEGRMYAPNMDNSSQGGRMHGFRISEPVPGRWIYTFSDDRFVHDSEIVVFAQNASLTATSRIVSPHDSSLAAAGAKKLEAQIVNRYPITGVEVAEGFALMSRDDDGEQSRRIVSVHLHDDGENGDDLTAYDGVYSGVILSEQDGPFSVLRVDVRFVAGGNARPAANVAYEPGVTYGDIMADYETHVQSEVSFETWSLGYARPVAQ